MSTSSPNPSLPTPSTSPPSEPFLSPASAQTFVLYNAYAMIACSVATFVLTMFVKAPYGRHASSGFGPKIPAKLAWFVMETPTLWTSFLVLWERKRYLEYTAYVNQYADSASSLGSSSSGGGAGATDITLLSTLLSIPPCNLVVFLFFLIHYVQRSVIYPLFRMSNKATPVPLAVPCCAFLFCIWNGSMQSMALVWDVKLEGISDNQSSNDPDTNDTFWCFQSPLFCLGLTVGALGMLLNIHADSILLNLRAKSAKEQASGKKTDDGDSAKDTRGAKQTRYKIPRGGLFELVSAANLTAEIVEWLGFAVAQGVPGLSAPGRGVSLPAWAFALYTFSNVGPRGHHHHKWYCEIFGEEYEKLGRKAVVPFLW